MCLAQGFGQLNTLCHAAHGCRNADQVVNLLLGGTRGFLDGAYDDQRANLRMQIIGKNGGIDKLDFEMLALAVSAVNGCSHCVAAHEHTIREEGASKEQVNDLIRIAATMGGVAQGIQLAEALG